ncbi:MAG: IS701 family transposase [Gammaproteobacteria bacterium]
MDGLAETAGHADRHAPFKTRSKLLISRRRPAAYSSPLVGRRPVGSPWKAYGAGLLLPGERKSGEPMAARLAPGHVKRTRQSLHHLVADAPWNDEAVLGNVRGHVLTAMRQNGPVAAWVVEDTGFVKKGTHSVGVARQYCGQAGKQENCRVAVSLSVAADHASLPIAWRLYLPRVGPVTGNGVRPPVFPGRSRFKPSRPLRSRRFARR